ncbi:hypothetical protein FA15DRAFT_755746 [Coprinopsis marcescibilis]|uniref:Uncharacterized protein n=1 Tax=Coprinopsis marcescibilis TaxID=230819 RepID=A0A5C3KYZ3_COPMA|nr:hypothetical protein FA15DRAFT_755746 [Coprinopsis marcescibilis]
MESSPPQFGAGRRRLVRSAPTSAIVQNDSIASSSQAGPSRLPDLTQLVDVGLSDLDRSFDDLDSDEHTTPRLPTSTELPQVDGPVQSSAARLRALLQRVQNGSPPATPMAPASTQSVGTYESDYEIADTTRATATPSVAQTSISNLRSVFSHAMRPPGDTPQKQRKRRNSIDTSEVDSSPKTERPKIKAKRKSLSDEEVENAYRTSFAQTPGSGKLKSQPLTLDVLRQRFMNTPSRNLGEEEDLVPGDQDLSDDTADLLRELNSSRNSPPEATSTPQKSLMMSTNSQFQLHSNLLEQDSEMQRAIENLDSYEETIADPQIDSSSKTDSRAHVSFPSIPNGTLNKNLRNVGNSSVQTSVTATPRNLTSTTRISQDSQRQRPKPLQRSPSQAKEAGRTLSTPSTSRFLSTKTTTPRSRILSSPRPSDGASSSGSVSSRTDYKDRINELDDEENGRREDGWNRTKSALPRPSSSLSIHSPHQSDRQRTKSLGFNSASTTSLSPRPQVDSPSFEQTLRRHHSLTEQRQDSPTGSAFGDGSQEEDPVIVLERERNWNSPRPVWYARARADSISSVGSTDDDGHNPTSTANRLVSPRPTPEKVNRLTHNRMRSTPDLSSPRQNSPHINGRLAANALASISSPSQKRHSLTSLPSLSPLQHSSKENPSFNRTSVSTRTKRLSLQSPSKSSIPVRDGKSTIRASRKGPVPVPRVDANHDPEEIVSSTETDQAEQQYMGLQPPVSSRNDVSPQELTPTQKTIEPPPLSPPFEPTPVEPSPLSRPTDLTEYETDPDFSSDASDLDPNQPFNSTPLDPSTHELPSFTATPPREGSSHTRSIPRSSSPALEGPEPAAIETPSTTDDESSTWKTPAQTRLFPSAGDVTALKTPKPPGGWSGTPAPKRRSRAYSDSTPMRPILGDQESDIPAKPNPNWTAVQTPRPPGGWLATPAPQRRKVEYADQSVETDTEQEIYEPSTSSQPNPESQPIGLATPVSSISKGTYYDIQTPAAPGAWMQTPGARKSIMKVRFDPEPADTREISSATDGSSLSESADQVANGRAPLETPPGSPDSVNRSPSRRKPPTIRLLDAYGNETKDDITLGNLSSLKTPRRQPIRLVDALGNLVDDTSVDAAAQKSEDGPASSGTREQMVSRVRQGLDDLVQELHDLDQSNAFSKSEVAHIKELDSVSVKSRETRKTLARQMRAANEDMKQKMNALSANFKQATPLVPAGASRRFPYLFTGLVILQVILAIVWYHLLTIKTHEAFLTTYYDPFNPNIHLYSFRSRLLLDNAPDMTSWTSLLSLIRQLAFKEFLNKSMVNLHIQLLRWQTFIWEKWGTDVLAAQNIAWPPT